MALLHLVAHSLYKAHAFLSAGGVAQRRQALRLTAPAVPPSAARWGLAAVAGIVAIVGAGTSTGALPTPAAALAGAVLAVSLSPLLAAGRVLPALGVATGWLAGHALASAVVSPVPAAPVWGVLLVAAALAVLFALQALIALRPGAAWVRRLHPWAYGGFHLDERVSQALFAAWPVPPAPPAPTTTSSLATDGARA
jgi:NAD(P)H-quinone oxidoreductase subunit 5